MKTSIHTVKKEFPFFQSHPHTIYFDSAGTTLKHASVIAAINDYYTKYSVHNSNRYSAIGSALGSKIYGTRKLVANFIGADNPNNIVFTPGTTAGINQIAFGLSYLLKPHHNIVISHFEHSANYSTWVRMAHNKKASIRFFETDKQGQVFDQKLENVIDKNTFLVSLANINNSTGFDQEINAIVSKIKLINPHTIVVIDAAQAIAHEAIDVQKMGIDFLVFGAHKIYGPTGIGVLWGKTDLLLKLEPLLLGGGTIESLEPKHSSRYPDYNLVPTVPQRLEAGTLNAAGIIGLASAIEFFNQFETAEIKAHEVSLKQYFMEQIKALQLTDRIQIFNPLVAQSGTVLFTIHGAHPQDVAHFLGERNIIVRAGDFCVKELTSLFDCAALLRISFGIYNTTDDIDKLLKMIKNTKHFLVI